MQKKSEMLAWWLRLMLAEAPVMEELAGFGRFLQNLKNQGMHPYLMGDFPVEPAARSARPRRRRPYVVNK